jgi:hypothetical protein
VLVLDDDSLLAVLVEDDDSLLAVDVELLLRLLTLLSVLVELLLRLDAVDVLDDERLEAVLVLDELRELAELGLLALLTLLSSSGSSRISKPMTLHGSFVTVIAPPDTVPGSAAGGAVKRSRTPPGVRAKMKPPTVPRSVHVSLAPANVSSVLLSF